MKKLLAALAVALITLTGCGHESRLDKAKEANLKHLALTFSELPDGTFNIPDNWTSMTEERITLRLPAEPFEAEPLNGRKYGFKSDDAEGEVFFNFDVENSNSGFQALIDKNGKSYKKAFRKFGLEFDGTPRSLWKNAILVTDENIMNASEKTKSDLSALGAMFLSFDKAYDVEGNVSEQFVFHMAEGLGYDYCVYFFGDENVEGIMYVNCTDKDTALRIAATADIAND